MIVLPLLMGLKSQIISICFLGWQTQTTIAGKELHVSLS